MKTFRHDLEVGPPLQPLDNESFTNSTCTEDEARLEISNKGIWGSCFDCYFCEVKIFNHNAATNGIKNTKDAYLLDESLKRLKCQDRIVDIEQGSFSQLIIASTVEVSPITHKVIRRIASLIAKKNK